MLHKLVNVFLAISGITTLSEASGLTYKTTTRRAQLEGPQESVDGLEVRSTGEDLVDNILHASNSKVSERLGNDVVVYQRNTLTINLSVTSLVDKGANSLQGRFTIGDVWLNELQHVHGGLVDTEEGGVVDLSEAQQLQNLSDLRADTVDTLSVNTLLIKIHTSDSDYQQNLSLRLDEEGCSTSTGETAVADEGTLSILVFLFVLLSLLVGITTSKLVFLNGELFAYKGSSASLFSSLLGLKKGFRDRYGLGGHSLRTTGQEEASWKYAWGSKKSPKGSDRKNQPISTAVKWRLANHLCQS